MGDVVVTFKDGNSTQHVTPTETQDLEMTGSESEAPTVIICNAQIDFEGGGPTGPVANGVIYTAPVANGVIYSESPKFFDTSDPPSEISEVIVSDHDKIIVPSVFSSNVLFSSNDVEKVLVDVFCSAAGKGQ